MQGNGSYSVVGVFRRDAGTAYNVVPFWLAGSTGPGATIALGYAGADGSNLELGWGLYGDRWRYNSGFTLPAGNWYFIACTVQANGANPTAHMWMGIGGALVDKLAGISRTETGGSSATATPNVTAAPLRLGTDLGSGQTANASYASLFVYGRPLSQAEVGLMYTTMKAKMAARGVTLQ
jgi:hypothetical protein